MNLSTVNEHQGNINQVNMMDNSNYPQTNELESYNSSKYNGYIRKK